MKRFLFFCAVAGALATGCGDNSGQKTQATNSASGNPITAPVDYLGAVGKAKQSAEKTVDVAALNQAIQTFEVQEGRYPKDLNELVEKKIIRAIPQPPYGTKIVYDSTSGAAKIVKQ